MKTLALFLILCFGSLAFADDFKTINGKEYKNAKVSRVEPDGIVLTFSGGIAKIPFTELSPEVQKKYGYDSQAAGAYSAERNEQQARLARQRQADEQQRLEQRQKYWSEHPMPQQVQPQSGASSMHGGALDQQPAGSSSAHGSMLDERPAGGGETVFVGRVVSIVPNEGAIVRVDPQLTQKYGPVIPPAQYSAYLFGATFQALLMGSIIECLGFMLVIIIILRLEEHIRLC
jgi:hypothetical protein